MNFRAKNIQHYDLVISLFGAKIQIHITKVKKINKKIFEFSRQNSIL